MAWRPEWDVEHGLNMLFYQGDVVMMGNEDIRLMLDYPDSFLANGIWSVNTMNESERLAYETVMKRLKG